MQRVDVHAHASGGRGDQPYIAVTVGDCLTYLYDRDALAAHVRAWREAAAHNQSLRLPTAPAAQVAGPDGRQDVSVVCTVFGAQQHAVTVEAGQSTRVLSVVVGAVTVRVHSSAAVNDVQITQRGAAAEPAATAAVRAPAVLPRAGAPARPGTGRRRRAPDPQVAGSPGPVVQGATVETQQRPDTERNRDCPACPRSARFA